MESVNLRQARERLSELIHGAELGESITITRRGKKVAMLGPVAPEGYPLPDLQEFRDSLILPEGAGLSATVIENREQERF
ncbi:MAG: type II toxin-antitoxin system prevent-host-death family antitoxin [Candidatus Eremiobacteraeota bacterium]|nr:type II toxin-antitoxin system prevent-host-death family antitoxin [Candidatus Eremiobacteraeota bacterium]MCW5867564.1 type II toxin-antitoxin system prevent-host-death family antitoxin [Candidatus Eremiobacteraeota bacterium]